MNTVDKLVEDLEKISEQLDVIVNERNQLAKWWSYLETNWPDIARLVKEQVAKNG